MRFVFHPEALQEYEDAVLYYRDISPSLASVFIKKMEEGIQKVIEYPEAWQEVETGIRRHLVQRFPYGIYYSIQDDYIMITAVMHMSRKPGYWQTRLKEI